MPPPAPVSFRMYSQNLPTYLVTTRETTEISVFFTALGAFSDPCHDPFIPAGIQLP